ncbi:uncharacterized protein LOC110987230 [Acanthaster planci]|uniref:Uncharacterized protein LOC110987230 n=1 Tax=Acanthaster planci TaxID=133434 RepID=A0A8B7ZPY4_ACAPL|nr:uncharacterized protein LOC110987230 [Acanthaster planci]
MADIEATFHQVKVPDGDCNALRFLWWPGGDHSKEPTNHQMLVHLYGATSSPGCAGFCLRRTAEDNPENFDEETVTAVQENFYVGDRLVPVKTEDEVIRLANQLMEFLAKGGVRLTKWVCNSREVTEAIPVEERAQSVLKLDFDHLPIERTLGVKWDVEADKLGIQNVSDPSQWRYVDSASHPADDGSRGLTADEMIRDQRWLHGPEFLWKDEEQ